MDFDDYKHLLSTQMLTLLQVHIYKGPQMTFINTVLHQTAKLIPSNVSPTFVTHCHPLTAFGRPPFCILNQKYIKNKQELYKLIITLIFLTQGAQPQPDLEVVSLPELTLLLSSVLKQYEELSEVGTVLNQEDLNPYWLLLNPISKWKQGNVIDQMKKQVKRSSHFFVKHDFNSNYFLYRLNLLDQYSEQLKKEKIHSLSIKFIKICQLALLKHLKANSSTLFEVVLQQPSLKQIDEGKVRFLLELGQIQQKNREENKVVQGVYGTFRLPGEHEPKKEEAEGYTTMQEKFIRAMIKPASVTAILLITMLVLKK